MTDRILLDKGSLYKVLYPLKVDSGVLISKDSVIMFVSHYSEKDLGRYHACANFLHKDSVVVCSMSSKFSYGEAHGCLMLSLTGHLEKVNNT